MIFLVSEKLKVYIFKFILIGAIALIMINQKFSLARYWSKRIMWPNIPLLNQGDIGEYTLSDIP